MRNRFGKMIYRKGGKSYVQLSVQLGAVLVVLVSLLLLGFFFMLDYNMKNAADLAKEMQTDLMNSKQQLAKIIVEQYNDLTFSLAADTEFRKLIRGDSQPSSQERVNPKILQILQNYLDMNGDVTNICYVTESGLRFNVNRAEKIGMGFGYPISPESETLLAYITDYCGANAGMHYFSDPDTQEFFGPVFHQGIALYDFYTRKPYGTLLITYVQNTLRQAILNNGENASKIMLVIDDDRIMIGGDQALIGVLMQEAFDRDKAGYSITEKSIDNHGLKLVSMLDLNPYMTQISKYRKAFVFSALGMSILYLLCSYLLMKRANQSINLLMHGFNQMKSGIGKPKIRAASRDEFGYLIEEFNSLSESLAKMALSVKQSNEEKLRVMNMQHRTLLHSLQSQINFHFLANTINMISATAIANNDYQVPRLLKALSNTMRYTFEHSDQPTTVQKECDWLNDYLMLQKERTGNLFSFAIHPQQEVLADKMYKLLIQPFVENSINHGFNKRNYNGLIEVFIRRFHEDGLVISIRDNGSGIEAEKAKQIHALFATGKQCDNIGVGINNVVTRIHLHYPQAKLLLRTGPGGTKIDLFLPKCNHS